MKFLINLLAPSSLKSGFAASQEFLKGKKTYLAGAILLLQAAAALVEQFCGLNGLGDFAAWLKDFAQNGAVQQFGLALAMMGLRAGISKSASPAE